MSATTTRLSSPKSVRQLPLPFGSHTGNQPEAAPRTPPEQSTPAALTAHTRLSAAITAYTHLIAARDDVTKGTRYAMTRDLDVTGRILGMSLELNSLTPADIERVTASLLATAKPATVERRLSTLSQFIRWLTFKGCVNARLRVAVPKAVEELPTILSRDQVQAVLDYTAQSGDPRLAFLVRLVLTTAMKRQDVLALKVTDLHLEATPPMVRVGQGDKARKIVVPAELNRFWLAYAKSYAPVERAFEGSYKPLEGSLAQVSSALKWNQTLTFSASRWTAALHDLKSGMPPEQLRLKMGLSALQWKETLALLRRLEV
jgi:integrase/recombinase XerD